MPTFFGKLEKYSVVRQFGRVRFHHGRNEPDWWDTKIPEIASGKFDRAWIGNFLERHRKAPIVIWVRGQRRSTSGDRPLCAHSDPVVNERPFRLRGRFVHESSHTAAATGVTPTSATPVMPIKEPSASAADASTQGDEHEQSEPTKPTSVPLPGARLGGRGEVAESDRTSRCNPSPPETQTPVRDNRSVTLR